MTYKELEENSLSPMMRQWLKLKRLYPEHILFFRLGDFYEMFFDDAVNASKVLNLALTGRDCGLSTKAPMCGIPYHSYEDYIKRLLDNQCSVAICEQMTEPNGTLVERDIVRIITPGTLIENSLLNESNNNYICCIYSCNGKTALAFGEVSTGACLLCLKETEIDIINELARYEPTEILMNVDVLSLKSVTDFIKLKMKCTINLRDEYCFEVATQKAVVMKYFNQSDVEFERIPYDEGKSSVCGLFEYIAETQKYMAGTFTIIEILDGNNFMTVDVNAVRNLEILETLRDRNKKGSLLWILEDINTSMGKRLLKQTLLQPLLSPAQINRRLEAVEVLINNPVVKGDITDILKQIQDIERLITKVTYKTATPRDVKAIGDTLAFLPEFKTLLSGLNSALLQKINSEISALENITETIEMSIIDEPPVKTSDGGLIKDGYSEELDNFRNIMNNCDSIILEILNRERERTGIKNLKIMYDKIAGYCYEVTRSFYDLVPPDYIRKRTLTNCERFITDELKKLEADILGAKDKAVKIEQTIFDRLLDKILIFLERIKQNSKAIATVDVLCSFADIAAKNNYTKPEIAVDGIIHIKDGRHPVIEKLLDGEQFVPNDTYLDSNNTRLAIITGPNMSGKSTYMRQTAIIVLLAQIGCFVPASYAKISVCDKIFTRIGASDNLAAGQSTFMVEMSEVADILDNATKNSLVIVDEIGRGTSTFDGISIARAVAEYICNSKKLGCKTLFATHYHELTDLESLQGVKNLSVSVKKIGDDIRFLRKIVEGKADDSYGIEVAKLAGIPPKVVKKAKEILATLEYEHLRKSAANTAADTAQPPQVDMESLKNQEIINKLKKINVDELSPKECMEFLRSLTENF